MLMLGGGPLYGVVSVSPFGMSRVPGALSTRPFGQRVPGMGGAGYRGSATNPGRCLTALIFPALSVICAGTQHELPQETLSIRYTFASSSGLDESIYRCVPAEPSMRMP